MVRGDLDHWSGSAPEEYLIGLAALGQARVVIDVVGLDICDSTGIRILVREDARARAQGGWLRMAGVNRRVRRVLALMDPPGVFQEFDSVRDALAGAVAAS